MNRPNYDKHPSVSIDGHDGEAWRSWAEVQTELRRASMAIVRERGRACVAVDCYSGVFDAEVLGMLRSGGIGPDAVFLTRDAMKDEAAIDRMVGPSLGGDDPIFGRLTDLSLADFFDPDRMEAIRTHASAATGLTLVYGPGASLCRDPDLIVYADMPRWEEQLRQRVGKSSNLGVDNAGIKASLLYKRSFFVDWRVLDRHKAASMSRWDYLLDTTNLNDPKLVTGGAFRAGLDQCVTRPFRVVPFFDPAPWGGQWMKDKLGLGFADSSRQSNLGWGFDCVPEENSLLLEFGPITVEIPAMDLVIRRPRDLLGDEVFDRFGAEFPIRFDFLDTVEGGNLSLQVHPTVDYARKAFGLDYTQDESYYILDAKGGASVYLGVNEGVGEADLLPALERANLGEGPFEAERYAARWPARKHDHFLIPAGTVHCSGAGTVVLEISATPYLFTFKLWDWGRLGLDGHPRPINLEHGRNVIRWDRDRHWAERNLINRFEPIAQGEGWSEERTGLHELQFIETRRHWFSGVVPHQTGGVVNVLNLVEGEEAIVESPSHAFKPFVVHYAETFIVPAAVGAYTIRPTRPDPLRPLATLKASVRSSVENLGSEA